MLKRFIRQFFAIATVVTCLALPVHAALEYQSENQPHVIEKIIQFEQKGVLKQKPNGFLYIEVSNDFIEKALPLIDVPGKILPPRHYSKKHSIGAHISVMNENEQILNEIWEIKELGQEFSFKILEVRTVKINIDGKAKKLWLLAVDAPDLEQLRESYGLSPKLKGHDFHITLGYQVPGKLHIKEPSIPKEEKEAA